MSYAQRYARTKLVLYILCAVKRLLSAICGAGVEMGGHRNVHGIFTCFLPAESEESHGTWLTLYLCLIGARRSCLNLWKFSSGMRTSELRVVAAIHSLCLQTSLAVQLYILQELNELTYLLSMFLHYRPIQIGGKEKSNANTMHRKTGREILNLLECLTRRRVQHEIIGAIKPEERVNENKTGDTERECEGEESAQGQ